MASFQPVRAHEPASAHFEPVSARSHLEYPMPQVWPAKELGPSDRANHPTSAKVQQYFSENQLIVHFISKEEIVKSADFQQFCLLLDLLPPPPEGYGKIRLTPTQYLTNEAEVSDRVHAYNMEPVRVVMNDLLAHHVDVALVLELEAQCSMQVPEHLMGPNERSLTLYADKAFVLYRHDAHKNAHMTPKRRDIPSIKAGLRNGHMAQLIGTPLPPDRERLGVASFAEIKKFGVVHEETIRSVIFRTGSRIDRDTYFFDPKVLGTKQGNVQTLLAQIHAYSALLRCRHAYLTAYNNHFPMSFSRPSRPQDRDRPHELCQKADHLPVYGRESQTLSARMVLAFMTFMGLKDLGINFKHPNRSGIRAWEERPNTLEDLEMAAPDSPTTDAANRRMQREAGLYQSGSVAGLGVSLERLALGARTGPVAGPSSSVPAASRGGYTGRPSIPDPYSTPGQSSRPAGYWPPRR